jgi:hypothetical protein
VTSRWYLALTVQIAACSTQPTLVRVPAVAGPTEIVLDAPATRIRTCALELVKRGAPPLDTSDLIEMGPPTGEEIILGTGGLALGPALGYCWRPGNERPGLFAQFSIRIVEDLHQTKLRVVALRPLVLRRKGWLARETSRYEYDEIPVSATVEASLIARAIAICGGADLRRLSDPRWTSCAER